MAEAGGFLEEEDLSWALKEAENKGSREVFVGHNGVQADLSEGSFVLEIGGKLGWIGWLGTGWRRGFQRTLLEENQTGVTDNILSSLQCVRG